MKMLHIVVSRWKKNVSWVYSLLRILEANILIYDKENPDNIFNIPVNKGHEASVYLRYILDYYDKLPTFTFFIQDDEYAWHHRGSIAQQLCNALNSEREYYNINDNCPLDAFHVSDHKQNYLEWYAKYIEPHVPLSSLPDDWMTGERGCAQFLVHRNRIRRFPKEFYQTLYDWLLSTSIEGNLPAVYLEWTWHVLWGDKKKSTST
jgi:hypothetical protein